MKLETKQKIKKIFKMIWIKKHIVLNFIVIAVGLIFVILALYAIIALPFKWN
ncbi:hypothetical protein [Mycoplasma miroungirhinis]|uniref:Uncharacterized protein n=1 Tax=Mycoplasma miroungirhinis TaxID=754516 RepID=A0A6M4JDZ4_9MOLU|nr:hypothetical protein [Mycoplasma miroungirhinis]QJR44307.1 hypothetical protein HLA92_02600 [Mycoplasma miroungirhinis]